MTQTADLAKAPLEFGISGSSLRSALQMWRRSAIRAVLLKAQSQVVFSNRDYEPALVAGLLVNYLHFTNYNF